MRQMLVKSKQFRHSAAPYDAHRNLPAVTLANQRLNGVSTATWTPEIIHIINACIYILRDFGNLEKREDAINRLATMPFYL